MGRMKKFYEDAFGWKMNQLGAEMGNYVVVHTAETDESQMVKTPGTINGGFYQKTDNPLTQHPSVVVSVEDIKAAMKKVEAVGGKVIGGQGGPAEPDNIPGVGLYSAAIDSEGNRFGMLQPSKM